MSRTGPRFVPAVLVGLALSRLAAAQSDPLPSWNDGPAKQAITRFVADTTKEGSPKFVPPAERIAVFDNDGTLWAEQPLYFQLLFGLDRIKVLAPQHPEWKTTEPFKSILEGHAEQALAQGDKAILEVMMVSHAGMTTDQFNDTVRKWLETAKHPKFQRLFTDLTYQPMLELLTYLRAQGFKTFIVSGGGVEFMRVFAERVYGIPPEQVIGSSGVLKFEMRDGKPVLVKEPKIEFIDDKAGKPAGIQRFIGRPDPRVRQLGRRSADARVDCCRQRCALHGNRASHRRATRVGIRPPVEDRYVEYRVG